MLPGRSRGDRSLHSAFDRRVHRTADTAAFSDNGRQCASSSPSGRAHACSLIHGAFCSWSVLRWHRELVGRRRTAKCLPRASRTPTHHPSDPRPGPAPGQGQRLMDGSPHPRRTRSPGNQDRCLHHLEDPPRGGHPARSRTAEHHLGRFPPQVRPMPPEKSLDAPQDPNGPSNRRLRKAHAADGHQERTCPMRSGAASSDTVT